MNRRKQIVVKWDNEENVKLTPGYIRAVKQLLKEEILMMRRHRKGKYKEAWYCGVACIGDLSTSGNVEMMFGSKEDAKWLKTNGQVFVTVPF